MRYTFGTDTIASHRLQKVAAVFNPSSRRFIAEHLSRPLGAVLDIGCGPGHTTRMLASAVRSAEVYGLDNSENFLVEAMEHGEQCVFINHDVTRTPFPVRADALYARFILAHLPEAVRLADAWAGALRPHGLILIEEMENIETDIGVFQQYLAVNRGIVASQGGRLYAGAELSAGRYQSRVLSNECVEVPVRNRDAAAMFYPNTVSIWEREEYAQLSLTSEQRAHISQTLAAMAARQNDECGIVWKMRRIVLENTAPESDEILFI